MALHNIHFTYPGHQPNTTGILGGLHLKIMPPRKRHSWEPKKEKDTLLDLDVKIRDALIKSRDRCFGEDWWPRQGSDDESLLIAYGLSEFIQGILDEEERFKRDWEKR